MDTFNLTIRYKFFVLGLMLVGVVELMLWRFQQGVTTKDYLEVLAAGIALTALAYTALQVNNSYRVQERDFELRLKERTADIESKKLEKEADRQVRLKEKAADTIALFLTPSMAQLNATARELAESLSGLSPNEIKATLSNDAEKRHAALALLNFFEYVATCVKNNIIDEGVVRDFLEAALNFHYTHYRGYIELRRKELMSQTIFANLEYLSKKWSVSA